MQLYIWELPILSEIALGRRRVLRGGGDKGRVQKQLGRILVGLLHRWGMSTSEGTLRGNGVEHLGSPWV